MTKLLAALAGLAMLAACGDPTKKHDYSCTKSFGGDAVKQDSCVQFHITEVEGNAADAACSSKGGTWEYHACSAENRVAGSCRVDSASDYSLSGTPATVFFYSPVTSEAAAAACAAGGGVWQP